MTGVRYYLVPFLPKVLLSFFCFLISITECLAEESVERHYTMQRNKMVKQQIIARGISNKTILDALYKVKRHLFVPEHLRDQAYEDYPLPIGGGQTISQPYIVALMTEILEPNSSMKILEIGTGSGYQAAVLAKLCKTVYSIEIVEKLGKKAEEHIASCGYTNVKIRIGDGYKGWKEYAPFDGIIVTCAPKHIPQPLIDQLKEGGKMVLPVGERGIQKLILCRKSHDKIVNDTIIPVRFVPMVNPSGKLY